MPEHATLRPAVEAALRTDIADPEARKDLAQRIADYAVGVDISPVLSERLSPQYMHDHMGGLDGPEEGDLERLRGVEAYDVAFESDSAGFVVDRRSIFREDETKEDYRQDEDFRLVNSAVQDWFKENVFMKGRVEGADGSIVDGLVRSNVKLRYGIGECLKYGILHTCMEFPKSLHGADREKPMFIEMFAQLTNAPRQKFTSGYPYFHLWKLEELTFQMKAITYSDQSYLTVHMPGYD